jgi:hypothetical protein
MEGASVTPRRLPGRGSLVTLPALVLVALGLLAALDLVSILYTLSYHDLIRRIIEGRDVTLAEAADADNRQNVLGWTQIGLFLGSAVAFIVWFRAAYGNLPKLGIGGLRWHRLWAIVSWVIPIANLFLPKRLANDVWRGSDPRPPAEAMLDADVPVPWWHSAWWALFIADGFFDRYAFQKWRGAGSLDSLSSASLVLVASYALDLVAVAFAALVVFRTVKRQRQRTEMLLGTGAALPVGSTA